MEKCNIEHFHLRVGVSFSIFYSSYNTYTYRDRHLQSCLFYALCLLTQLPVWICWAISSACFALLLEG